jgi:membrane-bound lytic murein transglycosylase B
MFCSGDGAGLTEVSLKMKKILSLARVRAVLAAATLSACALGSATAAQAQVAPGYIPPATDYLSRTDVLSFMDALQSEYQFDLGELQRILGDARHVPSVVQLIGPERAADARPIVRSYPKYRAKFLTRKRIDAGVQYWQAHETDLRRAQAEFGVPAEVILGILGVETAFGRNTGSFRVVDALATIAFDGPRRQEYFREELKELLLLARELSLDPLAIKGSYAGAMGLPQFMPSSYRRHAVDFDGDGSIDLVGSPADAIGSVAKYLKAYGWTPGEPAKIRVQLPKGTAPELVSGLERAHTVADLRKQGVKFTGVKVAALPDGPCSVVELPKPGAASSYVAGFGNFEAITRYNRSTFYATAVLELADAIRTAHGAMTAGNKQTAPIPAS